MIRGLISSTLEHCAINALSGEHCHNLYPPRRTPQNRCPNFGILRNKRFTLGPFCLNKCTSFLLKCSFCVPLVHFMIRGCISSALKHGVINSSLGEHCHNNYALLRMLENKYTNFKTVRFCLY